MRLASCRCSTGRRCPWGYDGRRTPMPGRPTGERALPDPPTDGTAFPNYASSSDRASTSSTIAIRSPIHRITGTAIELPSAL